MKMHEDNYLGILTEWSHTEWSVIKHMRTEVSKYKNSFRSEMIINMMLPGTKYDMIVEK